MSLKRMLLSATLLAATPMVVATGALAQGFYIGGGAGYSMPEDSNLDGTGKELNLDSNVAVQGMFGYAFDNGFRAEVELGYRDNDVGSIGGLTGNGDFSVLHAMVNGYYDIKTGTNFTPYVGAGIGAAFMNFDGGAGAVNFSDQDDTALAYQGIAGVSYRFTPQLDGYIDYRYMSTTDASFTTTGGANVDTDYTDHRIMAGIRFYFGGPKTPAPAPMPVASPAPPPPPPPPPPPAPKAEAPRNYLVFFDFNQSTLTSDAQAIIRTAANNFRDGKLTRLEATGHADRAGPDAYNLRLSQRRAEAVKAELVRLGIPANQIGVSFKGESQPLVPTADGVREPQNRRVEIVLN